MAIRPLRLRQGGVVCVFDSMVVFRAMGNRSLQFVSAVGRLVFFRSKREGLFTMSTLVFLFLFSFRASSRERERERDSVLVLVQLYTLPTLLRCPLFFLSFSSSSLYLFFLSQERPFTFQCPRRERKRERDLFCSTLLYLVQIVYSTLTFTFRLRLDYCTLALALALAFTLLHFSYASYTSLQKKIRRRRRRRRRSALPNRSSPACIYVRVPYLLTL